MSRWSALDRLRDYDRIAGITAIARRYLAMNAFDGIVTILGLLAGAWVAGIEDARVVLFTGLATALAMATSGFWGAYLTETAERDQQLAELEAQTLTSLVDTRVGRASRAAIVIVTVVDGLSPLVASLVVLIPFMLPGSLVQSEHRYLSSLGLALVALFGLGLFLGRVSRRSALGYAVKTVIAGIMALALGYSLHFFE